MKICHYCNIEKPLELFGNDKKAKDGKKSKCASCHNDYMKAYYWRNREVVAARVLAYHYENRELANAKRRANRIKNLEKQMEHSRQWQKNNPEAAKAIKKNWNHKNRQYLSAKEKERADLKKSGNVPLEFIRQLQTQPCAYCGNFISGKMQIDHIVPISKGGLHTLDNLASACKPCNQSKSNKFLHEWLASK
jgi:5-methylcytosine-specific restriction endonuclease McrA